jgi:Uncharacterized protein conserved in bacteria
MEKRAMVAFGVVLGLLVACHEPASESPERNKADKRATDSAISETSSARLNGELILPQATVLPAQSAVLVMLVDVSRADAPSVELARQEQSGVTEGPIPFVLEYDPAQLIPGHSYAISARISQQDKLLYLTKARHPVLDGNQADQPLHIQVEPR